MNEAELYKRGFNLLMGMKNAQAELDAIVTLLKAQAQKVQAEKKED